MEYDRFSYVIYIKSTPENVWEALTKPEHTRRYWYGVHFDCEWRKGSPWKLVFADGRVGDSGELLECERSRRIVIHWRNEFMPELHAEGFSTCMLEIEPVPGAVELRVRHEIAGSDTKFIRAVSGGWPKIFSSLKSLLETGAPIEQPVHQA